MRKIRKIIRCCLLLLVIGFTCSIAYSFYLGQNTIDANHHTIEINDLPSEFENFKIGFISDVHLNQKNSVDKLIKITSIVNKQDFDMLIFGGDLYDVSPFEQSKVIETLSSMQSKYGKFAILGEKDITYSTQEMIMSGGFEIIQNDVRTIYKNGQSIYFIGAYSENLQPLMSDEIKNGIAFVANHEPDFFGSTKYLDIDFQLSGHSLGGVVNLPFYGPLFKVDGAKTYANDKFVENDKTLIISDGLGLETKHKFRLFTKNQIEVITLTQS